MSVDKEDIAIILGIIVVIVISLTLAQLEADDSGRECLQSFAESYCEGKGMVFKKNDLLFSGSSSFWCYGSLDDPHVEGVTETYLYTEYEKEACLIKRGIF